MHNIIFEVGDWSSDGHSFSAQFLVQSNKPLATVQEIHFMENEFLGSLCSEYGQNTILIPELMTMLKKYLPDENAKQVIYSLVKSTNLEVLDGIENWVNDPSKISFEEEDEHEIHVYNADGMVQIWVALLQVMDPTLTLTIVSPALSRYHVKYKGYPVAPEGSMHFYGVDAKGRHLNTPGYGVWGDCDDMEFYHGG